MKKFLWTNIFGFSTTALIIFFYHGFSLQTLIKSIYMYLILIFSAVFSFFNFLMFKDVTSLTIAFSWLLLVMFAVYIYRYSSPKDSQSLWLVFIILWLCVGLYNPGLQIENASASWSLFDKSLFIS